MDRSCPERLSSRFGLLVIKLSITSPIPYPAVEVTLVMVRMYELQINIIGKTLR